MLRFRAGETFSDGDIVMWKDEYADDAELGVMYYAVDPVPGKMWITPVDPNPMFEYQPVSGAYPDYMFEKVSVRRSASEGWELLYGDTWQRIYGYDAIACITPYDGTGPGYEWMLSTNDFFEEVVDCNGPACEGVPCATLDDAMRECDEAYARAFAGSRSATKRDDYVQENGWEDDEYYFTKPLLHPEYDYASVYELPGGGWTWCIKGFDGWNAVDAERSWSSPLSAMKAFDKTEYAELEDMSWR